jgi:hypothetical protein
MSVQVPFVALHTLAHGGFVYEGSYNEGRLMPTALHTVLTAEGSAHWLPVVGDTDGDGMLDEEEDYFGMDPLDPDENGDAVPDGRQLARTLASEVQDLPIGPLPDQIYAIDHFALGHYNCLICGEGINMGLREVFNPIEGRTLGVPFYNLHFMVHGSFSTDRDDLYPRMDPREVAYVLDYPISNVGPAQEPRAFALWNGPNPFHTSASTTIVLSLPQQAGAVDVVIYDVTGRKVRELFRGEMQQQVAKFVWDGRSSDGRTAAAGVYLCQVKCGSVTVSRKLTLLK